MEILTPYADKGERALLQELSGQLASIHSEMLNAIEGRQQAIEAVHPAWRKSAANLFQYLELRAHDIRPLQLKLAQMGLSSLGRAEAHVLATVRAVLRTLAYLQESKPGLPAEGTLVEFAEGSSLLQVHTDALLGPPPARRCVRIMVTLPSEAATDPGLIRGLVSAGMDCMRINCAHDTIDAWAKMIEHLRAAERESGRTCRVLMDLAGPKLRTGEIISTPVLKCRPQRDELGRVTAPARVLLVSEGDSGPFPPCDACIPVPTDFLAKIEAFDVLRFTDCRDAKRRLHVIECSGGYRWAESTRTFYIQPGIPLQLIKTRQTSGEFAEAEAEVGRSLEYEPFIPIKKGDTLVVTRSQTPGHRAVYDASGALLQPAEVPCTLPEVFESVKPGERIWFDDGKIGGVIREADRERLTVEIQHVPSSRAKLGADKGINLPDSKLTLSALTQADLDALPFVAENADLVGLSFIEHPEDVRAYQERLAALGRQPCLVLKIETRRAFEALPELMLAAMRTPCAGVMIARGDLAVECGFERMAELQEEILWICEAAHMPVIWATQVLESLAKSGFPSRSEITDAAMGERAECVMLNKGPHISAAVKSLDDILQRMQTHQRKKQTLLRQLKSWGHASHEAHDHEH